MPPAGASKLFCLFLIVYLHFLESIGNDLNPNCLDTLIVFLKEYLKKFNLKKKLADDNKSMKN